MYSRSLYPVSVVGQADADRCRPPRFTVMTGQHQPRVVETEVTRRHGQLVDVFSPHVVVELDTRQTAVNYRRSRQTAHDTVNAVYL